MKFWAFDFQETVTIVLLAVFAFRDFTVGMAIGALAILASLHAKTVISYLFPKRPDVFAELERLQQNMSGFNAVTDELQTKMTALQFGAMKR